MVVIPVASGFEFGAVHYTPDLKASDSTEFRVGLVNPSNSTLEVDIEVNGAGTAEVSHPESVELYPSTVTGDPRGSGWLVYGDGYLKPRDVSFEVRGEDFDEKFTVVLEARLAGGESGSKIAQRAVQVREREYTLRSIQDDKPPRVGPGYEPPEEEDDSPEVIVSNRTELEQTNSTEKNSSRAMLRSNSSESLTTPGSNDEKRGSGLTTLLLAAAAASALGLLYTVV